MGLVLEHVVPWGRDLSEYRAMFMLSDSDMEKRIAGFGDGPASFNCQGSAGGASITSFDPIYQFSEQQLRKRIRAVRDTIICQMTENTENYVWDRIKSINELESVRMSAMEMFLADYEKGRLEGRYVYHSLPDRIPAADQTYDIGLSSHFLLMYNSLGYEFHISAITEMLRVCREVRIFPLCDLNSRRSELTDRVIGHFSRRFSVSVEKTDYEFQRGADHMLRIGGRNI